MLELAVLYYWFTAVTGVPWVLIDMFDECGGIPGSIF